MRRLVRVLAVVTLVAGLGVGAAARPADAAGGSVAFNDPSPQTAENRSAVRIVVDRVDLPVSRMVVSYATEEATALAGSDFVDTSGSLVFDVGVRSASFLVQVRDDAVPEPTEHLVLRLIADQSTTTAQLVILDDDTRSSTAAAPSSAPSSNDRGVASPVSDAPSAAGTSEAAAPRPTAQQVRRRVVAAPTRRRVVLRQNPVTPFELRPSSPGTEPMDTVPSEPTAVDPVLALLAGLLLARVSAEVWFRSRLVAA